MPQPTQLERFPTFLYTLADALGKTDQDITFDFDNNKDMREFQNKFWAFRRALERKLQKLPKGEEEKRPYLERLYRNVSARKVKHLENYTISIILADSDTILPPLEKQLAEQMGMDIPTPQEEQEEEKSSFDSALERFGRKD